MPAARSLITMGRTQDLGSNPSITVKVGLRNKGLASALHRSCHSSSNVTGILVAWTPALPLISNYPSVMIRSLSFAMPSADSWLPKYSQTFFRDAMFTISDCSENQTTL